MLVVRVRDGASAQATLGLDVLLPDDSNQSNNLDTAGAVNDYWTKIVADVVAKDGAARILVTIGGDGDPGSCVDFDDVTVTGPQP